MRKLRNDKEEIIIQTYDENSLDIAKYLAMKFNTIATSSFATKQLETRFHKEIIVMLDKFGYKEENIINMVYHPNDYKNNKNAFGCKDKRVGIPSLIEHTDGKSMVKILLDTYSDFQKTTLVFTYLEDGSSIDEKILKEAFEDKFHNKKRKPTPTPKINYLMQSQSGFYLKEFELGKINLDFKTNYNLENMNGVTQTEKAVYDVIEKDGSGFVLFSGKPGTGKTTLIKYLAQKYQNKKFVYVTASVASQIGEPAFLKFALDELSNSVLIMEDGEDLFKNRATHSNGGATSMMLNITDGIMGDTLSLKVISTLNSIEDIDSAMLRKGRLLLRLNFMPIKAEQANKLAKKLKIDKKFDSEIELSEIYNIAENGNEEAKQGKIGF